VQEFEFDHLAVFAFSPEETTTAAKLPGQVPRATALRRRQALMATQQEIAFRKAKAHRGGTDEALYLKPLGKGMWEARSRGQAPDVDGVTLIRHPGESVRPGRVGPIRYIGANGYDLKAVPD
jgi:ribosomal protein S12 methylthiotransferase